MYNDVMVDLEYLASTDNAVITQIAMVPFDIETGFFAGMEDDHPTEAFNCSPHIQEQLQCGREIDAATLTWWMDECAITGQTPIWLSDSEESLDTALVVRIPEWSAGLFDWDIVRVWSHVRCGMGKLRHAYSELLPDHTVKIPWNRKNEWHIQTVRELAHLHAAPPCILASLNRVNLMRKYYAEKNHDALWDCVAQIKEMTVAWEELHNHG